MSRNSSCSLLSEEPQLIIAAGLNAASGFVSLLASCFVIALVVLFKKWRFFTQRLVLYLAVSVAFQSIAAIVITIDYNDETSDFYRGFCQFSGFVLQNATWMVLNAVASITVYVFVGAVFGKRTDRLEAFYFFLTFIFPLLFNWIPFIDGAYGRAGAWCWIRNEDYSGCNRYLFGQVLQFVLWYVPLYIILTVLIFMYVIILIKIHCFDRRKWTSNYEHKDSKQQRIKLMSREITSLLRYPLIYFIVNLFPLCLRIFGAFRIDFKFLLALWILTGIFFPLQGGFIALAFTLDHDTRKRLKWRHIKAAARELCQRTDNDVISEYPAEHVSDTEKNFSDTIHKARYHSISGHENGSYIELV